jgi:hypothetical protein
MNDDNVHETEPTNREDLKHTDTVSSTTDPDGTEMAIDGADTPGTVGAEQDPFDLDRDIREDDELTHDSPVNEPLGRMPGM